MEKPSTQAKRPSHPGYCDVCGEPKTNTGPRERTCGKDECLDAIYGPYSQDPDKSNTKEDTGD